MNPKILTTFMTVGKLLISMLGIFGLAHLIEPVELFLDQVPLLYEMGVALVAMVALFKPYFVKSANEVKGQMLRKEYEATARAQNADTVKGFFNYRSQE